MPTPLTLPAGYRQRPLALDDAAAIAAVMAAEELADTGAVTIETADLIGDWSDPSYDLGAHSVGVLDGAGQLVGYAEFVGHDRADAGVHPEHHGRGIGTALAGWVRERAAEAGSPLVGMPKPVGSPGDRLLGSLGWQARWTSWTLALPEGHRIPDRPLPDGHVIRAAEPSDHEALWNVIEDAFLEWSERDRTPLATWLQRIVGRPGFEPWQLRVLTDPAGEVVGGVVCVLADEGREGYVDKIAIRADQRGRGLAQAMLADTFAVARSHGAVRSALATDSRTGALSLYQRVGMVVTSEWVNRAVATGAGT